MKWDFEKAVKKQQQKEIESLNKELIERNEPYYEEIINSGFDNRHDFEENENNKFGLIFFSIPIFIVIIISLLWLLLV